MCVSVESAGAGNAAETGRVRCVARTQEMSQTRVSLRGDDCLQQDKEKQHRPRRLHLQEQHQGICPFY